MARWARLAPFNYPHFTREMGLGGKGLEARRPMFKAPPHRRPLNSRNRPIGNRAMRGSKSPAAENSLARSTLRGGMLRLPPQRKNSITHSVTSVAHSPSASRLPVFKASGTGARISASSKRETANQGVTPNQGRKRPRLTHNRKLDTIRAR